MQKGQTLIKPYGIKKVIPFIGPAVLVSVGYVDPGNWATDIEGGSSFGYQLLWVLLLSNIMAIILQINAAKLGIATGKSLAQNCKESYSKGLSFILWITAEIAAVITDLAEFIGASVGVTILTGIPLLYASFMTGTITFLILLLNKNGNKKAEVVVFSLVMLIAGSYLFELILAKPNWHDVGYHMVKPQINKSSLWVAIGILGATIMPHNIFLHSGLVLERLKEHSKAEKKKLFKYVIIDSILSLNIAWFINSAMIIVSASVFFHNHIHVDSLEGAYHTLTPLLGDLSSKVFAIALIASGLSSSVTGTMAGQIILEGFIDINIPEWIKRIVTMIPAMIIIALGVNTLKALVVSQVILSIQLPFTVIPLIYFTSKKSIMGEYQNKKGTTLMLILIIAVIIALNFKLILNAC